MSSIKGIIILMEEDDFILKPPSNYFCTKLFVHSLLEYCTVRKCESWRFLLNIEDQGHKKKVEILASTHVVVNTRFGILSQSENDHFEVLTQLLATDKSTHLFTERLILYICGLLTKLFDAQHFDSQSVDAELRLSMLGNFIVNGYLHLLKEDPEFWEPSIALHSEYLAAFPHAKLLEEFGTDVEDIEDETIEQQLENVTARQKLQKDRLENFRQLVAEAETTLRKINNEARNIKLLKAEKNDARNTYDLLAQEAQKCSKPPAKYTEDLISVENLLWEIIAEKSLNIKPVELLKSLLEEKGGSNQENATNAAMDVEQMEDPIIHLTKKTSKKKNDKSINSPRVKSMRNLNAAQLIAKYIGKATK